METWPLTLPQVPHATASCKQASGLLDPEERLYPVRTRTYAEHEKAFTFRRITVAQFQAFRSWWDATLNQCAPFAAPWLSAAGYDHHFCRFAAESPWEASMVGSRFDLTISVEVIATTPMDGESVAYWEVS